MQGQTQQVQSSERASTEDDTLYQENRVYSEYGAQHESLWEEHAIPLQLPAEREQQPYTPSGLTSQLDSSSLAAPSRSTPIAITRPSSQRASAPSSGFETDDDDDSVIDIVERDAIRLRRKYGDKVVPTAASYQPGMTDNTPGSMLKAPYLGSLSKSENFLMSLPPISLSDEKDMYKYNEDPPNEIGSYGSLRESHQRGKFLDGPSSYREPRSGQIRRLDHRGRYPVPGAGLSISLQDNNSLSIGERIQAAQKQKKDETSDGEAAGTSTLSMMLNEASKNPDSLQDETTSELEQFTLPSSTISGVAAYERSAFGEEDLEAYDKYDPPTMMSTSLTAFEVLHSASKDMAGYEHNHTQRFVQRKQAQYKAAASTFGNSGLPSEAVIREQRFQPLSRSLSDPTPHHLQRSPMLSPSLQQQLHSPGGPTALLCTPGTPGSIATAYWPHHPYAGMVLDPSATMVQQHASLANDTATTPDQLLHNPDTDAAFDMDME